jgi:hypothetical protein
MALLFLFKDKGLGGDSSGSYCHPLLIAKNQKRTGAGGMGGVEIVSKAIGCGENGPCNNHV